LFFIDLPAAMVTAGKGTATPSQKEECSLWFNETKSEASATAFRTDYFSELYIDAFYKQLFL
jgi:hypothetical protein